ncbi:MAG: ATP-binding protein, partial [Nocardioides sp.]
MSTQVAELPSQVAPIRVRLWPVLRFLGFAVLTFLAGAVGRETFDEDLRISLVWPLYGVVILWFASGSPATWPWDALGMSAAVAASMLVDHASWQQTVVNTVLAVPAAALWSGVMRRLAPDVWGAGGTRPIGRLRDLTAFLVASVATAVVVALARTSGLGLIPPVSSAENVLLTAIRNLSWILGLGALGLLLLPRLVTHSRPSRIPARPRIAGRKIVEVIAMLAVIASVAMVTLGADSRPLSFALVLGTVWAAFRLPQVVAVGVAALLGTAVVLATIAGRGPFVEGQTAFESAAVAQAFLITLVLTTLAIAFTIEERREAAERAARAEHDAAARAAMFSTVIEHLAEGVTVIAADDTYSVRNPAARRLTGRGGFLQPDPDDPERPVMVSASGEPIPLHEMPHSRARTGEQVIRETVRVRTRQGVERQLAVTSVPVRVQDDEPMVVNTLRDVTSEHEERDQLVAFAGVVAHDLKNPLTVIQGWSESLQEELAADGPLDAPALRSMVERVQSASNQMTSFIDDLLGITVARDRPLDLEPLDLSALAGEVAELRRTGEAQARIAVQPEMAVTGDRFLVRQLLDNLIGNAVKYVAAGVRPSVTVHAVEVGDELEISITDNGIGIPVESRQRVFDSFVRVHGAYTGTG